MHYQIFNSGQSLTDLSLRQQTPATRTFKPLLELSRRKIAVRTLLELRFVDLSSL